MQHDDINPKPFLGTKTCDFMLRALSDLGVYGKINYRNSDIFIHVTSAIPDRGRYLPGTQQAKPFEQYVEVREVLNCKLGRTLAAPYDGKRYKPPSNASLAVVLDAEVTEILLGHLNKLVKCGVHSDEPVAHDLVQQLEAHTVDQAEQDEQFAVQEQFDLAAVIATYWAARAEASFKELHPRKRSGLLAY